MLESACGDDPAHPKFARIFISSVFHVLPAFEHRPSEVCGMAGFMYQKQTYHSYASHVKANIYEVINESNWLAYGIY